MKKSLFAFNFTLHTVSILKGLVGAICVGTGLELYFNFLISLMASL